MCLYSCGFVLPVTVVETRKGLMNGLKNVVLSSSKAVRLTQVGVPYFLLGGKSGMQKGGNGEDRGLVGNRCLFVFFGWNGICVSFCLVWYLAWCFDAMYGIGCGCGT